jgi:hypothetical protein
VPSNFDLNTTSSSIPSESVSIADFNTTLENLSTIFVDTTNTSISTSSKEESSTTILNDLTTTSSSNTTATDLTSTSRSDSTRNTSNTTTVVHHITIGGKNESSENANNEGEYRSIKVTIECDIYCEIRSFIQTLALISMILFFASALFVFCLKKELNPRTEARIILNRGTRLYRRLRFRYQPTNQNSPNIEMNAINLDIKLEVQDQTSKINEEKKLNESLKIISND